VCVNQASHKRAFYKRALGLPRRFTSAHIKFQKY
jgi:hypothetical protein